MNHIYKTVWNSKLGTWTAVQETAKSHGKSASVDGGVVASCTQVGTRFAYTLAASAVLLMSGQAMAVTGTEYQIFSDNICFYDTTTQSVICGDATTSVVDTVDGKTAKSVAVGLNAKTAGESNVAVGVKASSAETASVAIGSEAKALHNQSVAIGQNAEANSDWDVSIGRRAGAGTETPAAEGRNIAIGDGALEKAVSPNNNIVMGTSAAAELTGNANVILGTYANSKTANKEINNVDRGVTASNVVAIGDRALATSNSAVAIGNRVKASGAIATAVGASANASGAYSISNGYGATSSGSHSIAIGSAQNQTNKTQATQNFAIAIGSNQTAATGNSAIAVGTQSAAATENSIAIGNTAQANTQTGAIAIGATTTATGKSSVALGTSSESTAQSTVAIGSTAKAKGNNAVAVGDQAESTSYGTVSLGQAAGRVTGTRAGNNSVFIGVTAGDQSNNNEGQIAIGWRAAQRSQGAHNIASGFEAGQYINGTGNVAMGYKAGQGAATPGTGQPDPALKNLNYTVAVGTSATVGADNTVAIGRDAKALAGNTISIGQNAGSTAGAKPATDAIFVGTGAGQDSDNNRLSIAIGRGAGKNVGAGAANPSTENTAIGNDAGQRVKGNTNVAISSRAGQNVEGHDNFAALLEAGQNIKGRNNIAIGKQAGRSADAAVPLEVSDTLALGAHTVVSKNSVVALGTHSNADRAALTPNAATSNAATVASNQVYALTQATAADKQAISATVKGDLGAVSVGNATNTRQIINVAAGSENTDAVNVAQLKAVAAKTETTPLLVADGTGSDPAGKVVAPAAADAGKLATAGDIANAINNAGFTLTAQGANGSLVNAGEAVDLRSTDNNIVISKAATDNTVNFKLADSVTIGPATGGSPITINGTTGSISGLASNLPATTNGTPGGTPIGNTTSQAAPTTANAANAATVGDVLNVGWNLQGNGAALDFVKAYDTVNFADGTGTTVTTETDGSKTTIKVNVNAQGMAESAQLPVVYTKADGTRVYKRADGNFYDAPTGGNVVGAGDVIASMQNATGSTTAPTKLTNVAAGVNATDAVNVSQLNAVKTRYYSVNDAGVQDSNYDNLGASGGNSLAAGVGAGATGISSTAIGHKAQATNDAAVALGWNSTASGNHSMALGGSSIDSSGTQRDTTAAGDSSMAIGFGAQTGAGASWSMAIGDLSEVGAGAQRAVALGNLANVTVSDAVALGSGAVADRAALTPSAATSSSASAAANTVYASDAATAADKAAISATVKGALGAVSVGSGTATRQIINVAAGSEDTDAVNVAQLKAVANQAAAQASAPLTFAGDSGTASARKLGETLTIKGGETNAANLSHGNNIGVVSDGAGTLTVKLAKNVNLGADGSITTGNTTVNNNGITIAAPTPTDPNNTVSLTASGLNNGGNKITNVANGAISATSTDAVNGSQLYAVAGNVTNVSNVLGGNNTYIGSDGTLTAAGEQALKTYDVSGETATKNSNVIDAIKNMNEGGIKYFHTNDASGQTTGGTLATGTNDSSASGSYSTAVGYEASATAQGALAMGYGAQANGVNSISIGAGNVVSATGINSISIGTGNVVKGTGAGAIGDPSIVEGDYSYSVGNDNAISSTASNSFVFGNQNSLGGTAVRDANGVIDNTKPITEVGSAHNSVVLGNQNTVQADNTMVMGNNVTATVGNSVYLGAGAAATDVATAQSAGATAYNSAIIGGTTYTYAGGTPAGVVTVGSVGGERRVQNVAAGLISATSTDAINGSQLYATHQAINALSVASGAGWNLHANGNTTNITPTNPNLTVVDGSNTTVSLSGNQLQVNVVNNPTFSGQVTANGGLSVANNLTVQPNTVVDMGGNRITNVAPGVNPTDAATVSQLNQASASVNALGNRVNINHDKAMGGVASAMATAGLPQAYLPGKSMIAMGGATYQGRTAVAVGLSTISDNGHWIIKGSLNSNSHGHVGATIGAGYQW